MKELLVSRGNGVVDQDRDKQSGLDYEITGISSAGNCAGVRRLPYLVQLAYTDHGFVRMVLPFRDWGISWGTGYTLWCSRGWLDSNLSSFIASSLPGNVAR